jgi:hypothetical protein
VARERCRHFGIGWQVASQAKAELVKTDQENIFAGVAAPHQRLDHGLNERLRRSHAGTRIGVELESDLSLFTRS